MYGGVKLSKSLLLTLYPKSDYEINNSDIIDLLTKAGWSLYSSEGKIEVLDKAESIWIDYNDSEERFRKIPVSKSVYFRMYHDDDPVICIKPYKTSLDIWLDLYVPEICIGNNTFFDYNWCYNNIVNALNKKPVLFERVVFEEY